MSEADASRDIGEIAEIDLALQRLKAGTYGECIVCNLSIPEQRLYAFPTAERCVHCQRLHEQHPN